MINKLLYNQGRLKVYERILIVSDIQFMGLCSPIGHQWFSNWKSNWSDKQNKIGKDLHWKQLEINELYLFIKHHFQLDLMLKSYSKTEQTAYLMVISNQLLQLCMGWTVDLFLLPIALEYQLSLQRCTVMQQYESMLPTNQNPCTRFTVNLQQRRAFRSENSGQTIQVPLPYRSGKSRAATSWSIDCLSCKRSIARGGSSTVTSGCFVW